MKVDRKFANLHHILCLVILRLDRVVSFGSKIWKYLWIDEECKLFNFLLVDIWNVDGVTFLVLTSMAYVELG